MTVGTVNENMEVIVRIAVIGSGGRQEFVDAVLDTGFNGFLTLPERLTQSLGLTWLFRQSGVLADGSTVWFNVYRAEVIWNGIPKAVEVDTADATSLLGTALLKGHTVTIRFVAGGNASVTPLP